MAPFLFTVLSVPGPSAKLDEYRMWLADIVDNGLLRVRIQQVSRPSTFVVDLIEARIESCIVVLRRTVQG